MRTGCAWYIDRFCNKSREVVGTERGASRSLILFQEQRSRANAGAKDFRSLSFLDFLEMRVCVGWVVAIENNECVNDGVPEIVCEASAASEGVIVGDCKE